MDNTDNESKSIPVFTLVLFEENDTLYTQVKDGKALYYRHGRGTNWLWIAPSGETERPEYIAVRLGWRLATADDELSDAHPKTFYFYAN